MDVAYLLSKFPRQIERHSAEVRVPKQIVQIVREQLEYQAQVIPPHKRVLQFH